MQAVGVLPFLGTVCEFNIVVGGRVVKTNKIERI